MTLPENRPFCSVLALAVAATCLATAPVSAEPGRRPVSLEFTYDPEASAATNYRTLLVRVRRACMQEGPRSVAYMAREQACIEGMTNLAVAQINRPSLMAAHEAARGKAERRQLAAQ
jgi:hypothetical protein